MNFSPMVSPVPYATLRDIPLEEKSPVARFFELITLSLY